MTTERVGAALPGVGGVSWPRLPQVWSERLRALARIQRGITVVRGAGAKAPAFTPDAEPTRARIYALSRLFNDLCESHDWRVRVSGPVPAGPVVLVANHVGYLDPLLLSGLVPALPIGKREVSSWPLVGRIARAHGVLFVDRGDPQSGARVLRQARRALRAGISILNFPEGTTSSGEEVLPFRRGIFGLARHARVPVVPIALRLDDPEVAWFGDALFLPHYAKLLRRKETLVRVRFGGALTPERYGSAAGLADEARAAIAHMLRAD